MELNRLVTFGLQAVEKSGITSVADFLNLTMTDFEKLRGLGARRIQLLIDLQNNPKIMQFSTLKELIIQGSFSSEVQKFIYGSNINFMEFLTYSIPYIKSKVKLTKQEEKLLFESKVEILKKRYNSTSPQPITQEEVTELLTNASLGKLTVLEEVDSVGLQKKIFKYIQKFDFENVDRKYVMEIVPLLDLPYGLKIENLAEMMIVHLLREAFKPTLLFQLKLNVQDFVLIPMEGIQEILENLMDNGFIQHTERGIKFKNVPISDYLENNIVEFSILSNRFKGYTLAEIGHMRGVSRERIRQLEEVEVDKLKMYLFYETKLIKLYENYDFTDEAFTFVFNLSSFQLNFIKSFAVLSKKRKNKKELLDSEEMTLVCKERLETFLNKDYYHIEGYRIRKERDSILTFAIQHYAQEEIRIEDFHKKFKAFLVEYNIEFDLTDNLNSFFSTVERFEFVVAQRLRTVRYYPYEEYEMEGLVSQIDFSLFMDKQISVYLIFQMYRGLCEEYDVRNEYELHYLLKKYVKFSKYHEVLNFTRTPMLKIRDGNLDRQILEVLYEVSPISKAELVDICHERFGIMKDTLSASHLKVLKNYLVDGVYTLDAPRIEPDILANLSEILTKDFYFKEDIHDEYERVFGEAIQIPDYYYKEVGYKNFSLFILSTKYKRADRYFVEEYIGKDLFTTPDKRYYHLGSYRTTIEEKEEELELFEFEPNSYISYRKIENALGITKKDFIKFRDTIADYVQDDYFTIEIIEHLIEESPLNQLGFSNWFFASLLKRDPRFRYQYIGNNVILKKTKDKFYSYDLISHLVSKWEYINVYDLMDYLEENFNIRLSKDKIIWAQENTELYYNRTMEMLFLNEEKFYEFLEEEN